MRVFYSVPKCASRSAVIVYEAVRVIFCCAEMKRYWGRLIGFGVCGYARSTSRDVNLFTAIPQAGGKTVLEVTPIACCPWCGKAIEPCRMK